MSFDLYFMSAEVPIYRRQLLEQGVTKLGFSYFDMRDKSAQYKRWNLRQNLPDEVSVFVSPGIAQKSLTEDELLRFADDYLDFVDLNVERVTLAVELDGEVPQEMIFEHRQEFWDRINPEKFLPVWRGGNDLGFLASKYDGVAVGSGVLKDRENRAEIIHAARNSFSIHGLNITTPELLTEVSFHSASTTGWLSPRRYGETHMWETHQLRRYTKDQKEAVRKRHRRTIEQAGLDPDLVLQDDRKEVTSLAIWAWKSYEGWLAGRPRGRTLRALRDTESGDVPVTSAADAGGEDVESDARAPVMSPSERGAALERSEPRTVLPGVQYESVEMRDEQGEVVGHELFPKLSPESMRVCDTCYVNSVCPKYAAGHRCAYEAPVSIKTREDLLAVCRLFLEMDVDRILFARFAEQLEGGFANPKVSAELDRFFAHVRMLRDVSDNKEFMRITVEGGGSTGGVMSRLFGQEAAKKLQELPGGGLDQAQTDRFMQQVMEGRVRESEP